MVMPCLLVRRRDTNLREVRLINLAEITELREVRRDQILQVHCVAPAWASSLFGPLEVELEEVGPLASSYAGDPGIHGNVIGRLKPDSTVSVKRCRSIA